jgi:hypothetical protein
VLGTAGILAEAIRGLARVAAQALHSALSIEQWGALLLLSAILGYVECYRGFIRSFNPRVVKRGFELARSPTVTNVILAPLIAMSLFRDEPARVKRAWGLVVMIVAMALGARHLPSIWRSILDVAVVLALTGGLVGLCFAWLRAVRRELGDSRIRDLP